MRITVVRVAGIVILAAAAGAGILLWSRWPFTQQRIAHSLSGMTGSRIHFQGPTRLFYFPHPGFEARDVEVRRGAESLPALANVRRLRLVGSWAALLTARHRLMRVEAEGLVVKLPGAIPPRDPEAPRGPQQTHAAELVADGAILETSKGSQFRFDELRLSNMGPGDTIGFQTRLRNPDPRSTITAQGHIGPLNNQNLEATPVSGKYQLADGDLSQYHGLAGSLSGAGTFQGPLRGIRVDGTAAVGDFEVNHNGNKMPLRARYRAVVDARSGDTTLEAVEARLPESVLHIHGRVAGEQGAGGKTAVLHFTSDTARIEDLLRLTTKARPAALSGPMTLRAHVVLPPTEGPFLRRVLLDGSFHIENAVFNREQTQEKVNRLSSRARKGGDDNRTEDGADAPRVLSELSGTASLRNGLANLSNLRFAVPGAVSHGAGTYDLVSKQLNLQGIVDMDATVSEASKGWKSVVLKPFNKLFGRPANRGGGGAELPVRVTGRYPRPKFQVSLFERK